ncbi:Poly A polymerase regulatory subunit [Orpheovirus IHUMI-LCC2]|uniref:Poly A polymerase regulatory subunit n=1 Tax=Orpheovirus IHUMI-LCC2 TaxID=2023057 RepID=A0A2I2L666_9VIRU|nr:Poly A polymerase regulatory subunit [Orpheovirus IHUMI-LCC2]SNW62990.1 Poly A polymerase regulatory subunit [Orpheovirus IHUMI-LCC2]
MENTEFKISEAIINSESSKRQITPDFKESMKRESRERVHHAQYKAFLSELQFFTLFVEDKDPIVVYIGATPNYQIVTIANLLGVGQFHLYDEGIKEILHPRIKTYNKKFDDEDINRWKDKGVYLICNIKNKSPDESTEKEFSESIFAMMKEQEDLYLKLNPKKALLQFKLPYVYEWMTNLEFEYLDGILLLQPWVTQISSECKLIPRIGKDGMIKKKWNIQTYQEQMYYHNTIRREKVKYKNQVTGRNGIVIEGDLTEDYDSALTTFILLNFYMKTNAGKKPTIGEFRLLWRDIHTNLKNSFPKLRDIKSIRSQEIKSTSHITFHK